jgi:hypothetical protein
MNFRALWPFKNLAYPVRPRGCLLTGMRSTPVRDLMELNGLPPRGRSRATARALEASEPSAPTIASWPTIRNKPEPKTWPSQRQQQPGAQRGCHLMPGASHLVEPPGVTGQRNDEARTSHGHAPTVPWAGAQR